MHRSMRITLDGVPVRSREISPGRFAVDYGRELYPGFHRLRFQFRKLRKQSSMILTAPFTVEIRAGDHDRLVKEGRRLIRSGRSAAEGLKMLLAALSMGPVDPGSEAIVRDIARGFTMIGDAASASILREEAFSLLRRRDARHITKKILRGERRAHPDRISSASACALLQAACCDERKSVMMKNEFSERIKQFFSGQE